MEEFESRLSDELHHQAANLPGYDDALPQVMRRGRNRRWVSRGASAFGALVLLGGSFVLASNLSDDPGENLEATDGGITFATQPPETTPQPTPAEDVSPDVEGEGETPPEVDPAVVEPIGVSLVVATGWGVGLVGRTGDLYAPVLCCGADAPTNVRMRPLAARDDLAGGLVTASATELLWLSRAAVEQGTSPVVIASGDLAAEPDDNSDAEQQSQTVSTVGLSLWDINDVDGTAVVLYSIDVISDDGTAGTSTLYSAALGSAVPPETLQSFEWTSELDADAVVYQGAAWLPEGGVMSLQSSRLGTCEWLAFNGPGADGYSNPYERPAKPADGCPHDSLGAATVNDEGTIAVVRRYLSPVPQLAVHDRSQNLLYTHPLAAAPDGADARWTELDMVGNHVLVSRSVDATDPIAVELDETVRVDIGSGVDIGVFYRGAPTFARSDIDTATFQQITPDSPLWFFTPGDTPPPEPESTRDDTPVTTPLAVSTPSPTPDVGPQPDATPQPRVLAEARTPTGRGTNVKAPGSFTGDDGCLDSICIGQPIDEALAAAAQNFGDEDTDTPGAEREGEAPADGEHVFITDTSVITITETDGQVSSHRRAPIDGASNPTFGSIGDILATLGPPAEVFNGVGEGQQVVWLFYETEAAVVGYGVTVFDLEDSFLLDEGTTELPGKYDSLPINSYWAQPPA
jgi:hypothetical protein